MGPVTLRLAQDMVFFEIGPWLTACVSIYRQKTSPFGVWGVGLGGGGSVGVVGKKKGILFQKILLSFQKCCLFLS